MMTIGLTGGIGMGKSTSAALLAEMNIPVSDTDAIARELVEPGQPALAEIRDRFGASILDGQGRVRRDELARLVFADATARADLETILHPRIRTVWQSRVQTWRDNGQRVGVVVIPLLYETGAEKLFDSVICVACARETQRSRLHQRGWNDVQIQERNAAQWPVEKKMERADRVIWTEGEIGVHSRQVRRVIESLTGCGVVAGVPPAVKSFLNPR